MDWNDSFTSEQQRRIALILDANVPLVNDKGRAIKAYIVLELNTTVPLPYGWQIYSNAFMLKFRSFVFNFQNSLGKQG